jgi:hypothetical protein
MNEMYEAEKLYFNQTDTNQFVLDSLNCIRSSIVKGDLLHALKEIAISEEMLSNVKNDDSETPQRRSTNKHSMKRFDLEEAMLDCWGFKEDLGTLLAATDNDLDHDELQNVLIGLRSLYDMKFQHMWNIFEAMIENGEI